MLAVLTFETDDREEQDTISSIATGGHVPPTVDRHGHRIRANPMKFFLGEGRGSDNSPTDLLADGEGPAALPLPKNPTPTSVLWATLPVCPPTLKSWLHHWTQSPACWNILSRYAKKLTHVLIITTYTRIHSNAYAVVPMKLQFSLTVISAVA